MANDQKESVNVVVLRKEIDRLRKEVDRHKYENIRLDKLINTAQTHEYWEAAQMEAVHQHERWYRQDQEKAPVGWFWTVVYLAAKAYFSQVSLTHARFSAWQACQDAVNRAYEKVTVSEQSYGANPGKTKHRIITIGAAAYHWFNLHKKDEK